VKKEGRSLNKDLRIFQRRHISARSGWRGAGTGSKVLCILLVLVSIVLSVIGCAVVYSAVGSALFYRQFAVLMSFIPMCFVVLLLCPKFVYGFVYRTSPVIYLLALCLLCIAHFIGYSAMGAQRWIHYGAVNFQPSELMKLAMILYLSYIFDKMKEHEIGDVLCVIKPVLVVMIPFIFVLKQPNLGTALLILFVAGVIFFVAGVKKWKFITVILLVVIIFPLIWQYALYDYQKKRVVTFLNPESDVLGAGYNIAQSKIAIGSGLLYGKGFARGSQAKLNFLPEKHTDFVFAMIAEEFGFVVVCTVLSLYVGLIIICYVIAARAKTSYGATSAAGIASMLFGQIFVNISMISGLMPVVGIALPFLSYGGSNLLVLLLAMSHLLSVEMNNNS